MEKLCRGLQFQRGNDEKLFSIIKCDICDPMRSLQTRKRRRSICPNWRVFHQPRLTDKEIELDFVFQGWFFIFQDQNTRNTCGAFQKVKKKYLCWKADHLSEHFKFNDLLILKGWSEKSDKIYQHSKGTKFACQIRFPYKYEQKK